MRQKCLHSIKKATDVMPLLFDYFQGVFSGRKIEKRMVEYQTMQYLIGRSVFGWY